MEKEIKLKINNHTDRQDIILALANSGYAIKVLEEKNSILKSTFYVVITPNNK